MFFLHFSSTGSFSRKMKTHLFIETKRNENFSSRCTLIDPSSDEERLMDGFLSITMNQHKEICGIHFGGKIGLKKEQVDICKKLAFHKVLELTDRIREAVADYYQ